MRGTFHLHLCSVVFSLAALLYGGVPAFASEPAGAPAPKAAEPGAHIALLLPVRSTAFARAAEAVRNGFLAAAKVQGRASLPIRVYAVSEEPQHVLAGYQDALAAGARVVVGPITRDAVTAVATSALVMVPTLALNSTDAGTPTPPLLYTLSLNVEAEARQIAELAWQDGRRSAFVVTGGDALARRTHQAFTEAFTRLGGTIAAEYAYSPRLPELNRLKQAVGLGVADMVLLALDLRQARSVHPYLGRLPLYATSQMNPGADGPAATLDLGGIKFVDMPWLLQPDHAAVMVYPRPEAQDAPELSRLYALGIDAYRIAQELVARKANITIDGVSGRLVLETDQQFSRSLAVAEIVDGKVTVVGEARP
jgi:outer membrane PBP1 activator LpoA protein